MPLPRPRPPHARAWATLAASVVLLSIVVAALAARDAQGAPDQKNVVFILTDDMTTSELSAMPNVQSLIAAQGTSFNEAYISFPLCCPSRATMMSGLYMHNHGVHGNFPPNGSWLRYIPHESNDLAVWMHDEGYYTVHIGKYMNGYPGGTPTIPAPPSESLPVPDGWDEWFGKVSEDALYFNYQLVERTGPGAVPQITFYGDQPNDYQTDVFSDLAVNFVNDKAVADQPFWLNLWFNSPHGPFDPAPRDLNRMAGTPLPKLPGYNEKNITDKPKWLQKQAGKRISKRQARLIDNERRRQEEQLISVDQSVGKLVQSLKDEGILDDTYIIFASDNGFFRGEHRIASGKYLPYDPASRVPLIIRARESRQAGSATSSSGMGTSPRRSCRSRRGRRTIRSTAARCFHTPRTWGFGPPARSFWRGTPAPAAPARRPPCRLQLGRTRRESASLGKRGVKNLEQEPDAIKSATNSNSAPAYRSIRTPRYEYTIYANGQTELYDMLRDPAQLNSLARNRRYRHVRKWLYDRLIPLSSCAGATCRVELGPDPLPLPKSAVKPKKKRKKGQGAEPPPKT